MFADDSLRPRRKQFSPASFIDAGSAAVLIAVLSFLYFAGRIESPWIALLPSALFTAAATLIFLQVRARFVRRRRLALERQAYDLWLTDDLLHGNPEKFNKFALSILLFGYHWRYVPSEQGPPLLQQDGRDAELALLRRHADAPVTAQDVLELADRARTNGRDLLVIATTATVSDSARRFANGLPLEVQFYDGECLAAMAWDGAWAPKPDVLEPYLEDAARMLRARRKNRKPRFAHWAISLRFAATALLLTAMSLITPYRQWYLLCAVLCLVISAVTLFLPKRRTAEAYTR